MRYSLEQIPGGEAGTDATVEKLSQMVHDAVHGPDIRLITLEILKQSGVDTRDHYAVGRALYNWIHENIRYITDPVNLETIQAPEVTLEVGAGDCDDHSALMAAMAMSAGIPARFHVSGIDRDQFQHIYPELMINGRWLAADTTEAGQFAQDPLQLPENKSYNLGAGMGMIVQNGDRAAIQQLSGGLLSDIWDDLKKEVRDAFNDAVDDIDISVKLPEQLVTIKAPVTGDASRAAVQEFLSNPIVIGVGILSIAALTTLSGRKKQTRSKAW